MRTHQTEATDLLQQIKEAELKDSKAKALIDEAKKLEQNKDLQESSREI